MSSGNRKAQGEGEMGSSQSVGQSEHYGLSSLSYMGAVLLTPKHYSDNIKDHWSQISITNIIIMKRFETSLELPKYDTKWNNAVGKMASINLLATGLLQPSISKIYDDHLPMKWNMPIYHHDAVLKLGFQRKITFYQLMWCLWVASLSSSWSPLIKLISKACSLLLSRIRHEQDFWIFSKHLTAFLHFPYFCYKPQGYFDFSVNLH